MMPQVTWHDRYVARERAERADAQANRQRIIDAARTLYAEEGLDVSFNAIAHRAGIGNATLYRHFAGQDELREAVFLDRVRVTSRLLEELAELEDPALELRRYLTWIREAADLSLFGLATDAALEVSPQAEAEAEELYARLRGLIVRARRAGAIRDDMEPEDVLVAAVALIQTSRNSRIPPERTDRFLAVVLRGLGFDE